MKIKSSPILGTVGLIYGMLAGLVIGHTITKDQFEASKKNNTVIVKEYIYADDIFSAEQQSVENVFVEPAIDPSIEKKIPNDLTKRCPRWESELKDGGFPVKLFSYIMWRESRCNPKAHNTELNKDGSQDLGLLQVNSTWKTVTKNICGTNIDGLFNPDCNLKVAKYLYDNGGAGHWSM